jgi:hypothetical protein
MRNKHIEVTEKIMELDHVKSKYEEHHRQMTSS